MQEKILSICSAFSIAVFLYLGILLGVIMYFNAPNSHHQSDKKFIVENGMTLREVVEKLHKKDIIKNPASFLYISQLIKGIDPKVRYGEYFFEKNTSYYKILHKMVQGNIVFRKITVAEGLSTHSILELFEEYDGLVGEIPKDIKEGELLPETYFYSYNDSKSAVLTRMRESMTKNLDDLWENRDKSIPVKTKQEALILASIVEKETGVDHERPHVAAVFLNRLRKGMKLQSDPTIIYSYAFGDKSLEREIRMSDIRNHSPYNTYFTYRLPPAPICNPGLAAIKAVLNPIENEYIFFVASGNGDHIFSSTLKEHRINVNKYRKLMKERKAAAAQEKTAK